MAGVQRDRERGGGRERERRDIEIETVSEIDRSIHRSIKRERETFAQEGGARKE